MPFSPELFTECFLSYFWGYQIESGPQYMHKGSQQDITDFIKQKEQIENELIPNMEKAIERRNIRCDEIVAMPSGARKPNANNVWNKVVPQISN